MPLKPHPNDPDKMVYVSRQYDIPQPQGIPQLQGVTTAQPAQEPVFIKHHGDDEGWSEWVCPDPKNYLMKCCDCGLVHEAQFGVVRYKSETARDDCDVVDDPNLQAVFRMRRSEEWTADDTAHRSGGLPMAQPEQEPVAWLYPEGLKALQEGKCWTAYPTKHDGCNIPLYTTPQRTEQNFCPRCGKRTADLTTIHTCTLPQEKNNG